MSKYIARKIYRNVTLNPLCAAIHSSYGGIIILFFSCSYILRHSVSSGDFSGRFHDFENFDLIVLTEIVFYFIVYKYLYSTRRLLLLLFWLGWSESRKTFFATGPRRLGQNNCIQQNKYNNNNNNDNYFSYNILYQWPRGKNVFVFVWFLTRLGGKK